MQSSSLPITIMTVSMTCDCSMYSGVSVLVTRALGGILGPSLLGGQAVGGCLVSCCQTLTDVQGLIAFSISKAVANGLVGQVLARPLFQGKNKSSIL